jgi:hypothetical protein
MKTSKVGMVAVAILLGVTGIGYGIAQAGGTHSEQPVLSFENQEIPQVAKSPADDILLTSAGQEFVPEDNWSGTDWQTRGPIETGSLPAESNADFDPFSRGGP